MKNRFDGGFIAGCIFIQTLGVYLVMATIWDNGYGFAKSFQLMAFIMALIMIFVLKTVNSDLEKN